MKKRWIVLLLTVLFLWIVISRFTELTQLKSILGQGQLAWVLLAVLVELCYYVVFSTTYWTAFYTVGIQTRLPDLAKVVLSALFVNLIVPAGGAGGAALFAEDLARRGKSAAGAAAGVLLQLIADFGAFALLLIPGMIYLFTQHDLKLYEIIAAVILLLVTLGLAAILLVGIWRPGWLNQLFNFVQHSANWLFGRLRRSLSLADDWAQRNSAEFQQASAAVVKHPSRLVLTIGVAFLAHLLDVAVLYLLFRAFNQPVSLGVLVAGYAVGILFWIVSITPQGIGVVEGMMSLTFTSLGIPGAVATTVALAFRGLTFWFPMLLGFFALQRLRTVGDNQRSLTEIWGVRFAALMVALMGVVNLISAVTPSLSARIAVLEKYSPLEVRYGGHLTTALAGFALLLLAHSLQRRKRVAWYLALGVLGLSIISHMIKGLDYEEALLAGGLMGMLWLLRPHFHARSDRPSIRQGLLVLVGALLFTLVYGITGFYWLDHHYSVNFDLWTALRQTIVMFTQFYDPGLTPVTRFGRYFSDSIYIVGTLTLGYAALMLLRPVFVRDPATQKEREHAQEIVENFGRSSLARLLLFDDKHYFFTPGGSVIGYALVGRTAVVLGDPIGPGEDLLPSIKAFTVFCQNNDWIPVFYQTLPDTLEAYKQSGFESICVGDEGIVNLETFTLDGKESKSFRSAVNKLTHAGFKFMIHQPPIPDTLLEELHAISDEWLTMMHGSEKRFSLGWFDDDYIRRSPIAAVHTPEGWISAFANIVPEYQINEITIDLMRRRKTTEPGTMEFLFVSLFQWAKAQGYHSFNLGLSSLFGVGEQPDAPAVERVMHFVYEHVNQFYNFKGLHSFKDKFRPEWSPRYLIYPGTPDLASAWLAVVKANSGSQSPMYKELRKLIKD